MYKSIQHQLYQNNVVEVVDNRDAHCVFSIQVGLEELVIASGRTRHEIYTL